jgi:glycosyltransferase involved in cell wall biosynthesis
MTVLPISVCIPVKNEEKNLPNCLLSLIDAFDDVVVVDSGSTDATVSIAKQAGAKVLDFHWDGCFPKKRNWTLQNHEFRHPWVLFLDADECLTPEVIAELRAKVPGSTHVGYWISFTNWFMGQPLRHGDVFRKLALFRKDAGQYERFPEHWWSHLDMEVHEHPVLNGTTGVIESHLEHRDYRGLAQYISRHNEYSTWEANRWHWLSSAGGDAWTQLTSRQRFKYRNLDRWWFAKFYWFVSYVLKRGFLDGRQGFVFAAFKHRYFADIRLKIRESRQDMQASC